MADLISFPFRLALNGSIVTHPEDSPDYYAELLAVLCGTIPGERDQAPLFGINDPTYSSIDPHELAAKVEQFGPPVTIKSVTIRQVTETEQDVFIAFDVNSTL